MSTEVGKEDALSMGTPSGTRHQAFSHGPGSSSRNRLRGHPARARAHEAGPHDTELVLVAGRVGSALDPLTPISSGRMFALGRHTSLRLVTEIPRVARLRATGPVHAHEPKLRLATGKLFRGIGPIGVRHARGTTSGPEPTWDVGTGVPDGMTHDLTPAILIGIALEVGLTTVPTSTALETGQASALNAVLSGQARPPQRAHNVVFDLSAIQWAAGSHGVSVCSASIH